MEAKIFYGALHDWSYGTFDVRHGGRTYGNVIVVRITGSRDPRNSTGRNNKQRAYAYPEAEPKEKKEVRKALYDALYHILEYSSINRDLSMAIGKALCIGLNANCQDRLQGLQQVENLRRVLRLIVTEAIDDESPPSEQKN